MATALPTPKPLTATPSSCNLNLGDSSTNKYHTTVVVGDFEERMSVQARITDTSSEDSQKYAAALGGEGMKTVLVFEFSIAEGGDLTEFIDVIDDLSSKLLTIFTKMESGNPMPWFGGLKASLGQNPGGKQVLQLSIFCKEEMLSYIAQHSGGLLSLTNVLKTLSLDIGLPFTMRDVLSMEGIDLEDETLRAEAVKKLHEKAKAIAAIPGHPQARDCKPCLSMSLQEFENNVCQAGGIPLSQVATMLGVRIVPQGTTIISDLLKGSISLSAEVQQQLFNILRAIRAPEFLVEFGSVISSGHLNFVFGDLPELLEKLDTSGTPLLDMIMERLHDPVASVVQEGLSLKEMVLKETMPRLRNTLVDTELGVSYHDRVAYSYLSTLFEAARVNLDGFVGLRTFTQELRLDVNIEGFDIFALLREYVPELSLAPNVKTAKLHEIFRALDKNGDGVICEKELQLFVAVLPQVVDKERLVWMSGQSEAEAISNLLLAADPAVLVDHPVPMQAPGITCQHFVAMWGPETASGAGPNDFLGLELALQDDELDMVLEKLT